MATQVQFRRGTTAENDGFTGALGEVTVDTTLEVLRVHDGSTVGGYALVGTTAAQTLTNKTLTSPTITAPTISGAGSINISGNITGANVSGGNVLTTGIVSATGNVSGGNLNTSSVSISSTNISGVTLITATTGNITTVNSTTENTGTLTVTTFANVTATTAASSTTTGALRVAGGVGVVGNSYIGGLEVVTGNITGGNLITAGILSVNSGGAATAIVNGGSNSVGNIGSATSYFNRLFATSTSALYADVAEKYLADADYPVGTVLSFGGSAEVTQSISSHEVAIAGVVSDQPAVLMNSGLQGTTTTVALIGRVPCRVVGPVAKGDRLVSSGIPGVAQRLSPSEYRPGCIIGKAISDYSGSDEGVVEIAVGKI
jgi:hypothetical protein